MLPKMARLKLPASPAPLGPPHSVPRVSNRRPFRHTPPAGVKNRWHGRHNPQAFPDWERPPNFMDVAVLIVEGAYLADSDLLSLGSAHTRLRQGCLLRPGKTARQSVTDVRTMEQRPVPTIMDVAVLVLAGNYLEESDYDVLRVAHPELKRDSLILNTWITRPWQPYRKRRWGFGRTHKERGTNHDRVNPISMIHFAWRMLDFEDRTECIEAFPQWKEYAATRKQACVTSVAALRRPKRFETPEAPIPVKLDPHLAALNTAALLRFDFNYGDLVRWLGGEYTNRRRDWTKEFDLIHKILDRTNLPSDYPPAKVDLAYRIQTEGVPLCGQYTTPVTATKLRDEYDNHPAVLANMDKIEEKFAKEEWKSFHLHFKRFAFEFIPGLVVNPIQWVFDKGKGRICIDCTNGPDPEGAINTHIPKPKEQKELECPEVFYQFAFRRFLRHILRMRISCPNHPILLHADDIEAAFRRILYHPDLAVAFSYVYSDYLIVPVGQVFGSRSAPSFYCVMADLRQALAACRPTDPVTTYDPLVRQCTVSINTSTPLATIPEDSHYPILSPDEEHRPYNASFVDDNGVASFADGILEAIQNSVMSAFEVFGHDDDRRGDCLQAQKWTSEVSESFMYLGFLVDTHDMTVSWPLAKRQRLHDELTEILAQPHPRSVSPKTMAHIIGVVRSAAEIAPWGNFLSFNLQNSLTAASRNAFSTRRSWWTRTNIYLSSVAVATIEQLLETLLEPEGSPLWTRPIALYLDRDPTHTVYSDASYAGIGGWSPDFGFLWRLTYDTLIEHGFNLKPIELKTREPTDAMADGLHINPLEYIGCLVNLWITLKFVMDAGPRPGGYILSLLSDNMTALSWMSTAARTKNPTLQGLARLGSALLVRAAELLTKVDPSHIPGNQNDIADALSRPPTRALPYQNVLDSVIKEWSPLRMCRICLLPSELLHQIAFVLSSPKIEDTYEQITTNLLTLELRILDLGVRTWDSPSTIYES